MLVETSAARLFLADPSVLPAGERRSLSERRALAPPAETHFERATDPGHGRMVSAKRTGMPGRL